ncbi:MAG: hypothetical protein AB8G05_14160 [Oligoflexales bacterium]
MDRFLIVSIFLSFYAFIQASPALANEHNLVISHSFLISKCWGQTRTKQTCRVPGKLGKINDTVSIYEGTNWVAAGVIKKRKGSQTTIIVEERFKTVRPGFLIINNSGDNSDLNPKYMFSKSDSY